MPMYDKPAPRMPAHIQPLTFDKDGEVKECQICGEDADDEMGEFTLPVPAADGTRSVVAHGGCGEDHGLELA